MAKLKYVEISTGLYANKIGLDLNGNSSIWISQGSNPSKKIQMNGVVRDKSLIMADGLDYFLDKENPDVKQSVQELTDYFKKYLMKKKAKESFSKAKSLNKMLDKILEDNSVGDSHQKKIAMDTVKNPSKSLMGGPTAEEAITILKDKFGYTDEDIKKLQESKVKYGDTEHSVIKIGDKVIVNAGRFKNAIATVIDMAISGGNNYKVEFEDGTKAIVFPNDLKLAESKVNKNTGESKMTSKAGSFLKNLNKLPERYQLMLEDMTKTTNAELIPQDLAIVLTKMTANSLMANNVPIYVRTGTGKEAAEGKSGKIKSTEQRTANDWTVACYGGVVEMSQPVVSVYNVKTKESWTASTSKENLKKWGNGGTTESKKKVSESFFKKEGEVNFETLANLKKELTGFGLKDGLDFNANLFGESLELYLKMPANALPEQILDLIERYGFGGEEGPSVDFEKEIKTSDGEEVENVSVNAEAPSEAKKKVAKKTTKKKVAKKKSIIRKPKLASGKKAVSKIKKF